MRKGHQNYKLNVFGSKNISYPGQLKARWTQKKYLCVQIAHRGANKPIRGHRNGGDLFSILYVQSCIQDTLSSRKQRYLAYNVQ